MSGNTRGKLKEHFEGVHRNIDWSIHHLAKSATLIAARLALQPAFLEVQGDDKAEEAFFMEHPMYQAVTSLTEGLQTFDQLAKEIYDKL